MAEGFDERVARVIEAIKNRESEVDTLLSDSRISEGSKEAMRHEQSELRGMMRFTDYLQEGTMTVEKLVNAARDERFKGINGVDPRPVPERGSWLSGMAAREQAWMRGELPSPDPNERNPLGR